MDDDTTPVPTPLLAAYERLYAEVGREPIARSRPETHDAWEAVRKLRNAQKRRRRGGER